MRPRSQAAAEQRQSIAADWLDVWPDALALWSRFTRLRAPLLCTTSREARREGLDGSFAMIRLTDQAVVIDLEQVQRLGLTDRPLEVMGHEIGHHIAAPASLTASGRVIARMRVSLPGVEQHAPVLANIYADLLINDRLQREHGLQMHSLYTSIAAASRGGSSPLWEMYMRTYEILWGLTRGTLVQAPTDLGASSEGDAQLCARLLRSYSGQWADGAGRFAALCFAYLSGTGDGQLAPARAWGDAVRAGAGADVPAGLSSIDDEELSGSLHPSRDPAINGLGQHPEGTDELAAGSATGPPTDSGASGRSAGQRREPFAYGEILRAMGLELTDHEVAVRWYREQALPHLIPFPSQPGVRRGEMLPEGFTPWETGDPLEDIDWVQTVTHSPVVIPGLTTLQRVYGIDDVSPPRPVPLDLDIYIDSSGSMPNPQQTISYAALAGTVLALSALRSGARVQATLWSGAQQFTSTEGFTTDRDAIMRVMLGHFGGGTAFPLHVLRDTYAAREAHDDPAHILVISDDGVTTIFNTDEQGTPGREIQARALHAAGGGGTWVLELVHRPNALQEAEDLGWRIEEVSSAEELVDFARRFARLTYRPQSRVAGSRRGDADG